MGPQFIVLFRGVEIGRYETLERAVGAAQSVVDTELGAGRTPAGADPRDLPQIYWQPPPMYFPFDALAYWRQQASRDVPPYPPAQGNQQFRGAPPEPVPSELPPGPALVYGGPPAAERREPPPTDYGPHPPNMPPPPAPVYGGPPGRR